MNTIFRERMEVSEEGATVRQDFTFVPSWVATVMSVMAAAPSVTPVWEDGEPVVGGSELDMAECNTVLEKSRSWMG